MAQIKNVAFVGASGALGAPIIQRLAESGNFNISSLVRKGSSKKGPTLPGVKVVEVDFESQDSLRSVLAGQDAVVSTLGNLAVELQIPLIEAAAASGVKRFIPSDFGGDFENSKARAIPVFGSKIKVQEAAIEASKKSGMTYTFIYCGALVNWGLENDFILKTSDRKPILVDGGETLFSVTYESTVGDAVGSVLLHPEQTKNRVVYVNDLWVSQKKLLELAQKAAPGEPWEPVVVGLDGMLADANAKLQVGDFSGIMAFITQVIMDPECGCKFSKVDNDLLGLGYKTEGDLLATFKSLFGRDK